MINPEIYSAYDRGTEAFIRIVPEYKELYSREYGPALDDLSEESFGFFSFKYRQAVNRPNFDSLGADTLSLIDVDFVLEGRNPLNEASCLNNDYLKLSGRLSKDGDPYAINRRDHSVNQVSGYESNDYTFLFGREMPSFATPSGSINPEGDGYITRDVVEQAYKHYLTPQDCRKIVSVLSEHVPLVQVEYDFSLEVRHSDYEEVVDKA